MTELRDKLDGQIIEMKKAIYGMDNTIMIFCLAKASDLSILLLGEHAVAKSTLARLWSYSAGLDFRVVTSSEVDEGLIAYPDPAVFREKNIVQMRRGELMERDHILVDEFFLWTNKHRAKLHQLLEEKTYAGLSVLTKTYTFASNPLTEHYAGQIEEYNMATTDRIDLVIPVFQPEIIATRMMMNKFSEWGRKEKELSKVITWEDYISMREEIQKVKIYSSEFVWLNLFAESMAACKYTQSKFDISKAQMQKLCAECNEKEHLCSRVALSKPRFLRATILLAKALAWYNDREVVGPEDIAEAINYTLPHRVIFLKDEKTIFEAKTDLANVLQMFNDDMSNWKGRGLLERLETIMKQARDPNNPTFLSAEAVALQAEVQESLPMKNYVDASVDYCQKVVKKLYLEKIRKDATTEPDKIRDELDKSGLGSYDKDDILQTILTSNKDLTFYWNISRKNKQGLEKLADAIIQIHQGTTLKIKPKDRLLKDFDKEIRFNSDLMTIIEERGRIKVLCSNPKIKTQFEELLK